MKKKILAALTAATVSMMSFVSSVSAEQAKAEEIRQMFKSGNFYVECQFITSQTYKNKEYITKYGYFTLAGENNKRLLHWGLSNKKDGKSPNDIIGRWTIKKMEYRHRREGNELRDFDKSDKNDTNTYDSISDVLYQDGKYYRFYLNSNTWSRSLGTAYVYTEDQLQSPDVKFDEAFKHLKYDLSLPDELAIFYWEDKFHDNPLGVSAPYYNGSSKRTIKENKVEKEYDCDQYIIDIKTMAGTNAAQEAYNVLYDNGQLVKIQKYFIRDGKEQLVRELEVKTITSEVPEGTFTIGKKFKVYEKSYGDMNDLTGKRKEAIEEIGGKQK